jgi:nucleoid DNA-binding protein
MTITREEMVRKLSDKSGYYQKDIRTLLQCLDEVVFDELYEVSDDNDVSIQLVQGVKIKAAVVPERDRVDPRTQEPIVVKATVKPSCKFSQDMRFKLQEAYDNKKNG